MKVRILFTVKYKGEYLVPGTETDMNKKEAGQAIDAGAAEALEIPKKETKAPKKETKAPKKDDAADSAELIEKAKALGIDVEGKEDAEIEALIAELSGE